MKHDDSSPPPRPRGFAVILGLALAGCTTAYADAAVPDDLGAIARLSPPACREALAARGVAFSEAPEVAGGVRLEGPLGGVEVAFVGADDVHAVLDCRLALALLAWAPALRAAGVQALRHLSALRRTATVRGSGRRSGHADGRAVDVRWFVLDDGSELDVLETWVVRTQDADPCAAYDEPAESAMLRRLVCDAVEAELFQIVVTPHHDRAHANHVHLEVRGDVDWTWVR